MIESAHIPRRSGDGLEAGYESLRAEGIRLVQELSGHRWTDYNPHDPGVTILEQLCFALTELAYRSDFDVEDLLADSSGAIPYDRLALYPPQQVFSSQATTIDDYRKLLFDAVPELENVWIEPVGADVAGVGGLYRIWGQVADPRHRSPESAWLGQAGRLEDEFLTQARSVRQTIERVYRQHRNLCEDLLGVTIVRRTPYHLNGTIEVPEGSDPLEVLGRVYFEVAQLLSRSLDYRTYGEMVADHRPPDELFDGPLTRNTFIEAEALTRGNRDTLGLMEVTEMVGRLSGVSGVNDLYFSAEPGGVRSEDTIRFNAFSNETPILALPGWGGDDRVGITALRDGRVEELTAGELAHEVAGHFTRYDGLRASGQRADTLVDLPTGRPRDVASYHSIQNDFPDVYGINRFGLPGGASDERKSQAANLKGYLLLFEQLMADFLETLAEARRTFSTDVDLDRTYSHRLLTEQEVPGVEPLTLDRAGGDRHHLAEALRSFDQVGDRRNRVLDYLLALYGERLGADSLFLRDVYGDGPTDEVKIEAKVALLQLLGQEH